MSVKNIDRKSGTETFRARLITGGKDFIYAFSSRGIATCASSVAFFFFLSLIPMIILLSMLLPHIGLDLGLITDMVTALTPDSVDGLLIRIIREAFAASAGILPATVLLLIWSSAAGMMALIRGLNRVYQTEEKRNGLFLMLLSILYTIILLIFFVSIMYLTVINRTLRGYVYSFLTDNNLTAFHFEGARYEIAFALSIVVFMTMYKFIPSGKRSFLLQFPGAAFTSIAFLIFSFLFAIYLKGANKYTLFYGSLSGTAIFLFWLYGCFYIFLIGAYLNEYFEESVRRLGRRIRRKIRIQMNKGKTE